MEEEFENDALSDLKNIIDLIREKDVEEISHMYESQQGSLINNEDLVSMSSKEFVTRQELLDFIRQVMFKNGYATKIKKSKADCYVIIGCDRGGKYKSKKSLDEQAKKFTGTRLIDCPFEIWEKRKLDGIWRTDIKNLSHNHEPSSDMSGHPSCRRFNKVEIKHIADMSKAGMPPCQILTVLRQNNSKLLAVSRTLYNVRAKLKEENLNGRSKIHALFEELGQNDFVYDVERDHEGHLTHLFFAHPLSIELTKNYSTIFVMDCTYKTNKFKMPLLDIVGVTSFNGSFYSCFVFLQKEEEVDYIWALKRFSKILGAENYPSVVVSDREMALMNAINVVFPRTAHLLCVWHIEKNILAKCKGLFKEKEHWDTFMQDWTYLIKSPDERSFDANLSHFEGQYQEKPTLLKYIKGTWIPYKNRFVYAWTNQITHFGNHASSRAEGAHAVLKRYLYVSTGDFREVKEKICLAIENQYQEIRAKVQSDKVCIPHKYRIPLFQALISRISVFALHQLFLQHELAASNRPLDTCKSHFTSTMGLPCAHKLREKKDSILQLGQIHPQWRIDTRTFTKGSTTSSVGQGDEMGNLLKVFQDKYDKMPLVQQENCYKQITQFVDAPFPITHEPKILVHKGRPVGSKNKRNSNTTTRDPSTFEILEMRKCSTCQGVGHNSRTCPKNTGGLSNMNTF